MTPTLTGMGRTVPAVWLRMVFPFTVAVVALARPLDLWTGVAVCLALAGAASPWVPLAWAAIATLGLAQVITRPGPGDWHPYLLLAGLMLLHVLAVQLATVPWRARVALRVLARPLLRGAVIAAAGEVLLAGVLALEASAHPLWIPAAAIAAAALLALVALLFARLLPGRN